MTTEIETTSAFNDRVKKAIKRMNEAVKDIKPIDTSRIKLPETFSPGEEYTKTKKQ